MFRQIFGSKLQHPDPEQRLQAIDEIEADDGRLQEVALSDEDAAVRRAALSKISSLEALGQAADSERDEQTRLAARSRLGDVLCTEVGSSEELAAREACLTRFAGDTALVEQVVTQASDSALRSAALARVSSEALLAKVAASDPAGQLRSRALERVSDESLLEEIARSARNRDKGVARLARERADAARLARERAEEADRLGSEIERLAGSALDAVDTAAYVKLDQEWEAWADAVEGDFAEARARYGSARERIQGRLTGRAEARRRADEILTRVRAATAEVSASAQLDPTALRAEWASLTDTAGPEVRSEDLERALAQYEAACEARAEDQRRIEAIATWLSEREAAAESVEDGEVLGAAWEALEKPSDDSALAPLAARFQSLLGASSPPVAEPGGEGAAAAADTPEHDTKGASEASKPALSSAELEKRLGQLNKRLDEADKHIAAGDLKPATAAFDAARAVSEQLGKARGNAEIRAARERLGATGPKLNELRSWRKWSTDRARERLCDEVEQLLTSEESQEPVALARTIRGYRESWKKLDKAEGGAAKSLWERFNKACTQAYEPCRKHFAAEADQRNENLAKKVALVERLESLASATDWDTETTDWRALDKAMGQFRREWRAVGPVNRRDNKPLMERHDKVRDLIDGRLVPLREQELDRRRKVVAALKELAEREDLRGAADQAKRAQAEWTPLVRGPRKIEQALWTDFRAACDRIFERLREQREVAQGARDDALKSAQEACERIEGITKELSALGFRSEDRAREDELTRAMSEARSAYGAAGEVPRAKEGALKSRYRKACDGFDAARRQRREARQLRGLSALAERANLASQLEQAVLRQAPDCEECVSTVSAQWDGLEATQDKGLTDVAARYERALEAHGDEGARANLGESVAANLKAREQLCLELEIATGVESPAHLKAQRMAFQIDRLQASMSGTDKPSNAQIEALLRRWFALGPVAEAEHEALEERFARVSAAALKTNRHQ